MALEAKDLVAGYGDIVVLQGVSVAVPTGVVVPMLRSTRNRQDHGPQLPSQGSLRTSNAGEIIVNGADLRPLSPHECVQVEIAHVPQGRQLFPFMSVRENLLLGAYAPRSRGHEADMLDWLFSIFPLLKERLGQTAGSLSGGGRADVRDSARTHGAATVPPAR